MLKRLVLAASLAGAVMLGAAAPARAWVAGSFTAPGYPVVGAAPGGPGYYYPPVYAYPWPPAPIVPPGYVVPFGVGRYYPGYWGTTYVWDRMGPHVHGYTFR